MVRIFGRAGRFHIYGDQLFYLVVCSISFSWGRQTAGDEGVDPLCFQEGNFSTPNDCRAFVSCMVGKPFFTSRCAEGTSFDAFERKCLPSQHVDCSRHCIHHHLEEPSNRLIKRAILEKSSIKARVTRSRRGVQVRARPWGLWDDAGVYIPYIGIASKNACPVGRRVVEVIPTTSTLAPERATTPEYEDEIITDIEDPSQNMRHNYGNTLGPNMKNNIGMKKVYFLSEDMDAGAMEEIKVGRFVMGGNASLIWTQKPNQDFTVSLGEEVERSTEAAGPWGFTKIIKSK